ncbi:DUF1150 domain-containing protein [Breoghania sp. L-A4]|uniref:BQ00720 family protein n=1 Tax=Breoghania sp. L-A4 TaxID=2304600 RepID=UPI000E359205|nr:DUF1150 domain-containing protein [Breoghania sp. L-A4]AXS42384.1 DUF1150 domain-containing protein [Breoghania sp. L-A4]
MVHDEVNRVDAETFAHLGDGDIAYIREVRSEDVKNMFPNAPQMIGGMKLWALLSADGSPIMLADSRDAVIANAMEAELTTVSVH